LLDTFGARAFSYAGPKIRNSLAAFLRNPALGTTVSTRPENVLICSAVAFRSQRINSFGHLSTYLLTYLLKCDQRTGSSS